ncbi:hypothetical protein BJX76DRAFT_358860 [Aspergillus varians]
MPMNWNDQADAKLLVAIITQVGPKLNWAGIAEYMGPDCTVSAVQHRIQRIKEKAKAKAIKPAPMLAITAGESGKSNPNSNAKGGDSPAPVLEKRKRGRPKKTASVYENADGDEENGSPAKMQKGGKGKPIGRCVGGGKAEGKTEMDEEEGEESVVKLEEDWFEEFA